MEKVKKMLPKFCGFLFFGMMGTFVSAQKISYQVNSQTGALQTLSIARLLLTKLLRLKFSMH